MNTDLAERNRLGAEMRRYLRARHTGVLSTISVKLSGYPFGSITPFVLDHQASPVILISRLAEHHRNMSADCRASLLAQDGNGPDVQAAARVTLVGDAQRIPDAERSSVQERYLRFFPEAIQLVELGDFEFWTVRPKMLRFIGGFGRIHWIDVNGYSPPVNSLATSEAAILTQMNTNDAEKLAGLCSHHLKRATISAMLVGVDCDGLDLRADGLLGRIEFDTAVHDADEALAAFTRLVAPCR